MKKYVYLFLLLSFLFMNYACNNSFSPEGDFQRIYILNSILRSDTSYQVVTISQSYDSVNSASGINPSVPGANVKIFYHDSIFIMKESTISRPDTSENQTPANYYYLNNLYLDENKPVSIEADLPSGKVLRASTVVPTHYSYYDFYGDKSIPGKNLQYISVSWSAGVTDTADIYYLPKLYVVYYKREDGPGITFTKEIPVDYDDSQSNARPVYPQITKTKDITYTIFNIKRAVSEIFGPGNNISDFVISSVYFELDSFDINAAAYISAEQITSDQYTVRLTPPDFSNIKSGLGIFGASSISKFNFKVNPSFLGALGK